MTVIGLEMSWTFGKKDDWILDEFKIEYYEVPKLKVTKSQNWKLQNLKIESNGKNQRKCKCVKYRYKATF